MPCTRANVIEDSCRTAHRRQRSKTRLLRQHSPPTIRTDQPFECPAVAVAAVYHSPATRRSNLETEIKESIPLFLLRMRTTTVELGLVWNLDGSSFDKKRRKAHLWFLLRSTIAVWTSVKTNSSRAVYTLSCSSEKKDIDNTLV